MSNDSGNFTYRIVVKPWYSSVTVQRASLDNVGFDDINWENVISLGGGQHLVKQTLLQEIDKMFPQSPTQKPTKRSK